MKKRFTEEQIIKAIKRIEPGEKARDIERDLGVHEMTLSIWKRKYTGVEVSDRRELKYLKDENICNAERLWQF